MLGAKRKCQRVLFFGTETNAAAKTVFRHISVCDIAAIVRSDGGIFKHKHIALAGFRVSEFTVDGIGVES